MRRLLALAGVAGVCIALWLWLRADGPGPVVDAPVEPVAMPDTCRNAGFEGDVFVVCTVDLRRYRVDLVRTGGDGKPIERLDRLKGREGLVFAMNAGMYHQDFTPVGLYVEDGHEVAPLNRAGGEGNFFMQPNGVFYVGEDDMPGVLATEAYAAAGIRPRIATQSGPMLVIDGGIHPRFEPDGQSRYVRNGIGIGAEPHTAFFAISRSVVSLGKFARLFRDELKARNALFFDGGISGLYDGERYLVGGDHPVGPVVVVSHPGSRGTQ